MKWLIVSKSKGGDRFYPIHIIRRKLNATKIPYREAEKKPKSFWKGKNVIFHMVWASEHPFVWRKFYKRVANRAKNFWIEFDADQHLNNLMSMDKASWGGYLFLYNELAKVSNKFIWELSMDYNPFLIDVERIPVGIYETKWEMPIDTKRPIDFLGFLDYKSGNLVPTFRLLEVLKKQGYNTQCILLSRKQYNYYEGKTNFSLIKNTKFSGKGEKRFHDLLGSAKVFIDLSGRITLGRNIYESLFYGAIPVASRTYGATDLLVPQYGIEPLNLNLKDVYAKCMKAKDSWSEETIIKLRQQANNRASVDKFIANFIRKSRP